MTSAFNVEKGVALGPNLTVALSMLNLLNDRFAITLDNSLQGTHYARPRAGDRRRNKPDVAVGPGAGTFFTAPSPRNDGAVRAEPLIVRSWPWPRQR
jgi:hypothetical protein